MSPALQLVPDLEHGHRVRRRAQAHAEEHVLPAHARRGRLPVSRHKKEGSANQVNRCSIHAVSFLVTARYSLEQRCWAVGGLLRMAQPREGEEQACTQPHSSYNLFMGPTQ